MANHKSAKKRIRHTAAVTEVNRDRRGRARTSIKKVEAAIAGGDKQAASAALKEAEPTVMRSAQRGALHKSTASRKISRLAQRVAKMA